MLYLYFLQTGYCNQRPGLYKVPGRPSPPSLPARHLPKAAASPRSGRAQCKAPVINSGMPKESPRVTVTAALESRPVAKSNIN